MVRYASTKNRTNMDYKLFIAMYNVNMDV